MKRIRIQNDIIIKWRIYRLGEEYNLVGKNIVVKLYDSVGRSHPITIVSTSGNEITIQFEGRNQSKLGEYRLFLQENPNGKDMVTIDKTKAFQLVPHSEMEGGCPENPMLSVTTVDFESDIDVPATSCPFEIDDNGILTVKASGKQYILTPYVEAPTLVSIEYSTPTIIFTYNDVSADGGTATPTLLYSQTKTERYSDGSNVTSQISEGAIITYSGADTNGRVTIPMSTEASRHSVATIDVSVTLNGKSATKSATIYQTAYVPKQAYYVGHLNATKSGFSALSDSEIISAITKKEITQTTTTNHTAKANCFIILTDDEIEVKDANFVSGGLTTTIGDDDWNLTHEAVIINGKSYNVHGYRFNGVSEEDPLTYNFTIKVL